jgi:hypothetical protein
LTGVVIADPAADRGPRLGRVVELGAGAAAYLALTGAVGFVLLRMAAAALRHPYRATALVERFAAVVAVAWIGYVALAVVLPRLVARVGGADRVEAERLSGRLLLVLAGVFVVAAACLTIAAVRY